MGKGRGRRAKEGKEEKRKKEGKEHFRKHNDNNLVKLSSALIVANF